jgi:N6-adenosine-specific RNA methylase IME4
MECRGTMKKYQVIYADPPWSYYNDTTVTPDKNKSGKGVMRKVPYKVMSSNDIKALPVGEIADDNCILFIWTTDYHLATCCDVIKEWGFEYKTVGFAWQKLNKQGNPVCFMGAYTLKSGVELCLLATKGKKATKLIMNRKVRALVSSEREDHSKKPDEVRDRISALCGSALKVELFARQHHNGWDSWGDEVECTAELPCAV